jgi:hypothetical protein
MRPDQLRAYRDVLHRSTARWLTVRPGGIKHHGTLRPEAEVTILSYGPARTLYRHQRPVCRSLDGVKAIGREPAQRCETCPALRECIEQVLVNVVLDGTPYRLLLSYTSAKNFMVYVGLMRRRGVDLDHETTRIRVTPHGYWGELYFYPIM